MELISVEKLIVAGMYQSGPNVLIAHLGQSLDSIYMFKCLRAEVGHSIWF